MITSIEVKNAERLPLKWAKDSEFIKAIQGKKIQFSDGINLIVGPNGSGKSTLIKALGSYLMCEQGGYSKITRHAIRELYERKFYEKDIKKDGAKIFHDGQPCFYATGEKIFGFCGGGMAAFDDDFLSDAIENMKQIADKSSGQALGEKLNILLQKAEEIDQVKGLKEFSAERHAKDQDVQFALSQLQPSIEKGKKTIFIDELDANLDFENQVQFFEKISQMAEKYQIIMTAHSPLSVFMENVNIIETVEGYYGRTKQGIERMMGVKSA